MKRFGLIFLLLFPLLAQAYCRSSGTTNMTKTLNLDMSTGSAAQTFNTQFTGSLTCYNTDEKIRLDNLLDKYVVELTGSNGEQPIYMQLDLEGGDNFPVTIGKSTEQAAALFNDQTFTLKAQYISPSTYVNKKITNGNKIEFIDNSPALTFTNIDSCSDSSILLRLICYITKSFLPGNVTYTQNLIINVTHKPTTCRFTQHQYTINMPPTTTNNMLTGKNTETGKTELQLTCDGVHNVSTNPVSFKVADGDWDTSGQILKNTLSPGATGVGFQIFKENNSTALKRGDVLDSIKNRDQLKETYTFPITARYVRIPGEALQPGEMQSRVKFIVDYN